MFRKRHAQYLNLAVFFALYLVFMCPCSSAAKQQAEMTGEIKNEHRTIIFTTGFPEIMPSYRQYNALYKEIFQRMGYSFKLKYHPDRRTGVYANSGLYDGIPGRIISFNTDGSYTNLIRVDEAVKKMQEIAVAVDPSIKIKGWESLSNYKVTYISGNKIIEQNIYKHIEKTKIIPASDVNQAFRLLLSHRVDLFIEIREVLVLNQLLEEFKDKHFLNAGIVQNIEVYPFLHKKNKDLVPRLAETLRAVKDDGTYEKILKALDKNE